MMGAVTVLESGGVDEEELVWQVKALRNGVDIMFGITRDVLDLFALSLGKLRLSESWVNVRELLARCARVRARAYVCARVCVRSSNDTPARAVAPRTRPGRRP
jgi:hypothetical protein